MSLPTSPSIITIEEFLANPLGIDTSKLLKARTTLASAASIGANSLSIVDKVGSAPAAFNPAAQRAPSYGIQTGDPIVLGNGTSTDQFEITFVAGALTGTGPYSVPINPPLATAHPGPTPGPASPASIGALQQMLLSVSGEMERYCRQPLAVVTHPVAQWQPQEFELGSIWAPIDKNGVLHLYLPFTPIISGSVTSIQYKFIGGGSLMPSIWTTYDPSLYEVLTNEIVVVNSQCRRGDLAFFKAAWQSGWNPIPDDAKEVCRELLVHYIRKRGGQAILAPTGRRAVSGTSGGLSEEQELQPLRDRLAGYQAVR